MRKQCIITIERQLPVYRAVEVPKQGGGDYPAALPVTAPHPAPCGAAAPAVPAARCRRLSVSLSAVSLAHSARAFLPISKSKGRVQARYPCASHPFRLPSAPPSCAGWAVLSAVTLRRCSYALGGGAAQVNFKEAMRRMMVQTRNSCYTYFKITGDFDPDEVTHLLSLQPTRTWKIGDFRKNGTKYDFAVWEIGRCEEYDVIVENQMRKTIAPLLDKINLLNLIHRNNNVAFVLKIVPTIYVGDQNPCLAPPLDVIDFCHATRTEIDIDMYVYGIDE